MFWNQGRGTKTKKTLLVKWCRNFNKIIVIQEHLSVWVHEIPAKEASTIVADWERNEEFALVDFEARKDKKTLWGELWKWPQKSSVVGENVVQVGNGPVRRRSLEDFDRSKPAILQPYTSLYVGVKRCSDTSCATTRLFQRI